MKTKKSIQSFDDIIFENRNKLYGAYELRTQYNSRLARSMVITLSASLLIFIFIYKAKPKHVDVLIKTSKDSVVFSDFPLFDNLIQQEIKKEKQLNTPSGRTDDHTFLAVTDTNEKPIVDTTNNQLTANNDTLHGTTGSFTPSDTIIPTGNSENKIVTFNQASVDKSPEFPGGMEKFYKFLSRHIIYTAEARRAQVSVKMYIRFIVDTAGLISHIEFMNKVGYGLEEEVRNVLINSPQWSPGIVKNEPVKTEMILPVSFNIVQ